MLPRFQHVLVPVDFSPRNQAALEIAFEMAEVNTARVTLLHVIERIDAGAEDEETDSFYDQIRQRAESELESQSQRFVEARLRTEFKIRLGKRVEEIVRYVVDRDVDLVILNSHRIDADQPVKSVATLSYQVSILAPCPVLLVK
jgi:nucleotide-binding universal stress UspA family protein